MPWTAKHRFARLSPRKARLVVDLIRGKPVQDALDILKFADQKAGLLIDRVLRSAIANADEAEADVRSLVVQDAYINEGPRIKRFQPKDRGRAHPIIKPLAHIVVTVEARPEQREVATQTAVEAK